MSVGKLAPVLLSLALFALPASADVTLMPHNANGITYVSGGIGEQELTAITAIKRNYNLRLLFALKGSGEYLANIKVKLMDAKGNTVLDAMSDGPYFLAQVKPGTYKVVAENAGKPITRTAQVPAQGAASLSFYWAAG